MAQTIKLKRSSVAGNIPGSSDLSLGEIALNTADGAVYIKKGNNDIVAVADNDILHIDTTNSRIGIGTTSPDYSLDVRAASNVLLKLASTSASNNARMAFAPNNVIKWNMGVSIADNAFTWFDQDNSTSPVRFEVGAANSTLVVDSNSRVGIGTSSPSVPLHVYHATENKLLTLESGDSTVTLELKDNQGTAVVQSFNGVLNLVTNNNSAGTSQIRFSDGATEIARFNGSNLGIGTTSPDTRLDVTTGGIAGIILNQDTSNSAASSRLFFKDSTRTNAIVNISGNLELRTGATIGVSSGTQRLVINGSSGAITFNNAFTFPTADGSANQVLQTDGSGNLSFGTAAGGGVSISNNVNNRVLTGDGTNANAEANLTFDGSTLGVTGTISSGAITSTGASSFGNSTTVGNVELHSTSIGVDEAGILFQPNSAYRCIHPTSMTSTPHSSDISLGWSNNKWKDIYLAGSVRADSGYQVATTTVIDSSRNLTNIGTISSGAITAESNGNNQIHLKGTDTNPTAILMDYNGTGSTDRVRIYNNAGGFQFLTENGDEKLSIAKTTGNATFAGEIYAKDSNSTTDPTIAFVDHTDSGLSMSVSGSNDQLSVITDGVRRGYFNNAGITSVSNVYTSANGAFRNYGDAWTASTGLTGNGFSFINSVDGTALTLSSTGNAVFAGTVEATSFSDGTISGITFIDEDSFSTNSATRVPTQQSIKAYVDAQVAGVVDTAPSALNTLNELAAALGDDANFSTTTSTALGNRLRVDTAAQGLTGTQQANAITNLGITATKAELNFVDGVTSNIQTQLNGKQASGSYLTGNQTITLSGDVSGSGTTSIAVTIADDSHNHVISNVDGLQTALDAKLPLAGGTMGGHIAMANYNITGVNQLEFNDPGEGIIFKQGSSGDMVLKIIDDSSDNILQYSGTNALFDVVGTIRGDALRIDKASESLGNQPSIAATFDSTGTDGLALISVEHLTNSAAAALGAGIRFKTGDGSTGSANKESYIFMQGGGNHALKYIADKNHQFYVDHHDNSIEGTTYSDYGTLALEIAESGEVEAKYDLDVHGNYKMDNTTIIDTNKNLVNIGTISSGDITASSSGIATVKISGNSSRIFFEDTAGSDLDAYIANNANGLFFGKTNSPTGTNDILSLDLSSKNATFAGTISATGGNSTNWNTAYGWGNHASQSYATETYVNTQVSNLVDSSPAALNTLNELAAALGDDANFSTTVTNSIATKMPLAGGSFTGDVTFGTGADFGSAVASSTADLSRHLALWGTSYGFNITSSNINLVSAGTNTLSSTSSTLYSKVNHDFFAGIDVTGNITVSGTVDGRDIASDGSKLDGIESGATADQTQSDINALGITQVGTISSGTWNGSVISSAYLDSDTAHLSGSQTFTGVKTFNSNVIIGGATYASYGSGSTDITGLINGSTFGSIQYASASGHHVIGLRDNDNNDSFAVISGTGNWNTDSTYDKLVFRANATGQVTVGGNLDVASGVDVTGNITVTGTVDGRDIAADGTKLDTIATNADVTPSWVPSSNPNYLTGNQTITLSGDVSGSGTTSIAVTIADDSHNHVISNVDGLQTALDGKLSTTGTAANSQLLDSLDSTAFLRSNADDTYTGNLTVTGNINQTGALTATTKSFDIEHPSKEGMRLHHGVLEGPEHAVYIRGKSNSYIIELPDYWVDLIHEESITVQLTAIGSGQELYVEKIEDNKVHVNGENYFYYIQAERKDVERFEVEYEI